MMMMMMMMIKMARKSVLGRMEK